MQRPKDIKVERARQCLRSTKYPISIEKFILSQPGKNIHSVESEMIVLEDIENPIYVIFVFINDEFQFFFFKSVYFIRLVSNVCADLRIGNDTLSRN